MATKLDEEFVRKGLVASASARAVMEALASEVRRLEAYCEELEAKLTPEQIAEASAKASTKWK